MWMDAMDDKLEAAYEARRTHLLPPPPLTPTPLRAVAARGGLRSAVRASAVCSSCRIASAAQARPWRWYVLSVPDMKVITSTGLAPFNMAGKLDKIKKACAKTDA